MDTRQKVLAQLRAAEDYISGQDLCDEIGVSRTAVWKSIQALREEGYEIEAVTNRGYRLSGSEDNDVFNAEEITAGLTTKWAGRNLICKKQTGSTNDDILAASAQGAPEGTFAIALSQTAGKGRRGRTWISPDQGNIYMSLLLLPKLPTGRAPMVTLIEAMALQKALQKYADLQKEKNDELHECRFAIKWPNDVVVSSDGGPYKKLVGILTEMRLEDTEIRDVVIGTGVNVNMEEFPEELAQNATSMRLALGMKCSRAAIAAYSLNFFEADYEKFLAAQDFLPLREEYNAMLVNIGRKVRILDPQNPFTGISEGINELGELLVRPDDAPSELRNISAGEVSVRGVEGYV